MGLINIRTSKEPSKYFFKIQILILFFNRVQFIISVIEGFLNIIKYFLQCIYDNLLVSVLFHPVLFTKENILFRSSLFLKEWNTWKVMWVVTYSHSYKINKLLNNIFFLFSSIKGAYWIIQFFIYPILRYFCIASCKFIALPTIATAIVVALIRS